MAATPQITANIANIARVAVLGGATVYGIANSLFNVEGGHRAIVFNRVVGIKETVSVVSTCCATIALSPQADVLVLS